MQKSNLFKDLFKNFFSKDLHYKLFSLIVAIIAWFSVMNAIQPLETKVYQAPIVFENNKALMANGYIISNMETFDTTKIDVSIEATRTAQDDFERSNAINDIYAKVDLSDINIDEEASFPQEFTLNVSPKLPAYLNSHSYSIVSYTPAVITIQVDKISSVDKNLNIQLNGTPTNGYVVSDTVVDVDSVRVDGPVSKIDEVYDVVLNVDVNNLTSSQKLSVVPVVYDKAGNTLTDFVVEPSHIDVEVVIEKVGTITINKPTTTGKLPANYELSGLDWSPKSITVIGPEERLASVKSLDIPAIDISNFNGDTTISTDITSIVESLGLTIKNAKETQISTTFDINIVNAKTISISKDIVKVVGLPDTKQIILPDTINVDVSSNSTIDPTKLNPTIDVTGLSDGEHNVRLSMTPPANTAIDSNVTVDITIENKNTNNEQPESSSELFITPEDIIDSDLNIASK